MSYLWLPGKLGKCLLREEVHMAVGQGGAGDSPEGKSLIEQGPPTPAGCSQCRNGGAVMEPSENPSSSGHGHGREVTREGRAVWLAGQGQV